MDIKHVVVLMLENRSFDCMLGMLYESDETFDGLTGEEQNAWHKPGGLQQTVPVWKSPDLTPTAACIPDPDPGELFTDIAHADQRPGCRTGSPTPARRRWTASSTTTCASRRPTRRSIRRPIRRR